MKRVFSIEFCRSDFEPVNFLFMHVYLSINNELLQLLWCYKVSGLHFGDFKFWIIFFGFFDNVYRMIWVIDDFMQFALFLNQSKVSITTIVANTWLNKSPD